MSISTRRFPLLFVSMVLCSVVSLAGQHPGEIFVPPLKNFTVPVPDLAFGTRVQKSNNRNGGMVVFIGGMGELQRIDYTRLPPGALAGQDSAARLAAYENALREVVQRNRAEVLAREPLSVGGEPMLYALVRFPEASQAIDGGTGKRKDSFRGLLLFAQGEFLYTLGVEVAGIFGATLTPAQQAEDGKQAVQRFFGTITFQGSPVPAGQDTARAALADAGQIVFSSTRDGNSEIYVINADGSHPTRLTNTHAEEGYPAWSPDGTQIAFMSDRDGNPEIYVMNADGSNPTRLTRNPGLDGAPAWLPDGKHIVFASQRDGATQLYVMNADGSNVVKLTSGPAVHFDPNWSPDGKRLAGVAAVPQADVRQVDAGIFTMNADGTNLVQLTHGVDVHPEWSPDGARIAFASGRDGNSEIYVMNADGSNLVRQTQSPSGDMLPAWSPDGRRIAFHSNRDGNWEIYVMNADGSGLVNVTTNAADDTEPHWRPRK